MIAARPAPVRPSPLATTAFMMAVCMALLVLGAPASFAAPTNHASELDCNRCHACPTPTTADPCLKSCPRTSLKTAMPSAGPDVVTLGELADLYVPVRFNHKAHARMAGLSKGCESCHHYSPGAAAHPACRSCHPPSVPHEDLAQPGLKGAYHRQCFRCHIEWDKDTACEVCHEKRAGGKLAGGTAGAAGAGASTAGAMGATGAAHAGASHYAPLEIKEIITFNTRKSPGDRVPFHHRNHATLYETDCNACHQNESCGQCHTHGAASHPMGELAQVNLHDYCFKCHRQNGHGGLPDSRCEDCHGRAPDALFDHASTGWPLASFHRKLACHSCHGEWTARSRLTPQCESCHERGWDAATFDHRVTGVTLNEVHHEAGCTDCHTAGIGKPASCAGCHDDGRVWSRATGFGS